MPNSDSHPMMRANAEIERAQNANLTTPSDDERRESDRGTFSLSYFDDDEVRRHVAQSRDCRHGHGFTYDFCPIVNRVNSHQQLIAALRGLLEVSACQNGCPPDDMTCATNVARRVLAAVTSEKGE